MVRNLIPWRKKTEALSPVREPAAFDVLHRQMNDLLENFFEGFGSLGRWPSLHRDFGVSSDASPNFEVSETDDEVEVKAELPGLEEKDVEVLLDENLLTIRGEKKDEREEKKRNYYFSEVSYGQFQRSIPLPAGIDRDKAKATFKKGVLRLTLPKTEPAASQRRRIDIKSE
jgi:HSP20 family protein